MSQSNDLRPQAARSAHTPRSPHLLQTLAELAACENHAGNEIEELLALPEASPEKSSHAQTEKPADSVSTLCDLMRELIREQRHQTSLLEDLVDHTCRQQRRKEGELSRWRRGHPQLAAQCRRAAAALSDIQTDYLHTIVNEVNDGLDTFPESELFLGEFVDRFGVRFAHLNGLVQALAQLGNTDGRF